MKRALVLQHAAFEGPARLHPLLVERGYAIEVRRLYLGESAPAQLAPNELLVIMGGPMGVGDLERPECAFLRQEVELLRQCIDRDAPVLGVCLGAQLLAYAAGAQVYAMTDEAGAPRYEVGWAPVRFHSSGPTDAVFRGLPTEAQVLHWHGDTFDLPEGARLLASSSLCAHQAFQLRSRMFGLQFHCEAAPDHVEAFLREDADFVLRTQGPGGVERIRCDTEHCAERSWLTGQRFLGNILDAMTAPA